MKRITYHMSQLMGRLKPVSFLLIAVLFAAGGTWATTARADQFDAKIQALENQNSNTESSISSLQLRAANYQDAITKLQQEIAGIQTAISINETKQVQLQAQIDTEQQKLDQQKKVLGEDLKAMYVNGSMTTMEMLASSQNLSDFVDAETYGSAVQGKIQQTLNQITTLQNQLKDQQNKVSQLLATQQQQRDQLNSDESQQNQLLAMNQNQQDTYNKKLANNQQQIQKLRQEQLAANESLLSGGRVLASGACGGSYPQTAASPSGGQWGCGHPLDSAYDNWGMYNRECVSYTAWMVWKTYGYMPYWGGSGNANQWPSDARAAGIPTGSTPKVGSVAIYTGGADGHAMWVTDVNSDGSITVSQYNADLQGDWSEYTYPKYAANGHPGWSSFIFIYFGE